MNRRVLVIMFVGLVLLAGVGVIVTTLRPRSGSGPAANAPPPISSPAANDASKADAQALVPRLTNRSARGRVAPKVEPAASPASATRSVEAPPKSGILHIESDVPGALVFIDRVYIGAAPVTAPNVKPGPHRLNVSAQGYDGVVQAIDVAPGARDILVKLKDVSLDLKIEVVHAHRIGSCKGRLIATLDGLRYEASDTNDSFSSPLQDLMAFQVDYLGKTLSVTPRNGKRYRFTDPEGNVDRLFVFHRDVEKARERLAKGDPPARE